MVHLEVVTVVSLRLLDVRRRQSVLRTLDLNALGRDQHQGAVVLLDGHLLSWADHRWHRSDGLVEFIEVLEYVVQDLVLGLLALDERLDLILRDRQAEFLQLWNDQVPVFRLDSGYILIFDAVQLSRERERIFRFLDDIFPDHAHQEADIHRVLEFLSMLSVQQHAAIALVGLVSVVWRDLAVLGQPSVYILINE